MKTTKARLVDRIVRNDPKFNVGSATKFVDELEKSQGPLSKKTGKDSSLYKTVKAEIDARNPTVKSKKSGGRLPLRSKKTGETVKKNLDKFYKKIGNKVDPKFKTPKNLDRTELNLQFKADKLKQDYGGKFSPRDGLTAAERKKKLKELQRQINIKNPTITSPKTGGRLPATAANLKKFNLPPLSKTKSFKTPPKSFKSLPLSQKSGVISPKKIKIGTPLRNRFKSRGAVGTTLALAGAAYLLTKGNKPKPKNNNNKPIIPPGEKVISTGQSDVRFNLAGPGGGRLKLPNASDPSK